MQPDEIDHVPTEVTKVEQVPEPPITATPERNPFWGYSDFFLVLGLLFAMSIGIAVAVGILAIPFPKLRTDQTALVLPVQVVFYLCLYLSFRLVFKLRYHKPVLPSLGWQRPAINLAWMAGGGVMLAFVLSALGALLKTPKITSPFDKLTTTPGSFAFFAVVAIVLAPLFEELFFRGFVQPLLSRTFGTIAGILLTAALFGALHGFEYSWVWQYALFISLAGAVFGWSRARTNSIIPCAVMHGFFNAVSVVALAFGKDI